MVDESRINIYNYLHSIFDGHVTTNVYDISIPQELTASDVHDGFLVLHIGNVNDESEFPREAYGRVRCYVEAYVPPISRGRLNSKRYKEIEDKINLCIENAFASGNSKKYGIVQDSVLSMDGFDVSSVNNAFYAFAKSFILYVFSADEKDYQ